MHRRTRRPPVALFPLVGCLLAVVLGTASADTPGQAVAGPAAVVRPGPPAVEDPFPIRRVRATEAQLADALKQLDPGPLVQLPRGEFESRVRAAGRVAAAARNAPRIAEVRLKAALAGSDLAGSAELDVVNPNDSPNLLNLDSLRLAIGTPTWADGREALLGIPPGGGAAGVWIDRLGRQTLKFAWSAAGVTEPGERRFDLRVPAASVAVLDLELPEGQVPAAPATEVLLTGPIPAPGDPPRAVWRVRFGGRSRLDLSVRPAGNPGVTASATLAARYDVAPGLLSGAFEYDLRPAKGTVGEWEFVIDPGLRVTDVVVNNRAGWVVEPPVTPNGPRLLRVTLRQPGAGGKMLVSAVSPFPDPARPPGSPLPIVRPVGAVIDDESLEVRVSPGLKVENFSPGDYRLTDATTLSDQTRALSLAGILLPPGTDRRHRRPPGFTAPQAYAEFATVEQTAWRFGADRVTASLALTVRTRRGPLFGLSLKLPPGYSVSRTTTTPDELVSYSNAAGGSLNLEFARPLAAGQSAELAFEFRGPALAPARHQLPFPVFTPVGAAERTGSIGLFPASVWAVESRVGPGTSRADWFDPFGASSLPGAAAAFTYRGGDPDGRVELLRLPGAEPNKGDLANAVPPDPRLPDPPAPREWGFAGLYLVTGVRSESGAVVVFGGTITSAGSAVLPVALPPGAEVRAAASGGRWLEPGVLRVSPDGVLNLPVPAGESVRFEVRYRLRAEPPGPVVRVRSPEPRLPGGPEVRRWWAFAADVLPGWPVHPWDRGTAADLPALVGDPPVSGPGVVVSRSSVDELRVAETRTASAAGVWAAGVLLALAWAGSRRRHPFCGLLVAAGLLAVGAATLLGPPWWQHAAAVPLVVALLAAGVMVVVRGRRARLPAVAALVVGLCLLTRGDTVAQPTQPAVVVLTADSAGREVVVAPKALLDRLAAASLPPSSGVVLTSAEYSATVEDSTARVTAKFIVHAAPGESSVTLPLTDARLEAVKVGKDAALPTSPRPGHYAIALPGPGRHEVEVRFAVAVGGTAPEREFRFGVPDACATKVTAELPGGAKQAQVTGRVGRQTATPAGDRLKLEADAGALKAVQVRWRDGAGGTASVKVREGCVWDVSESGAELTACYVVTIGQGTVSSLRFDLPAELDPLGVTVRPLEVGGGGALRDWQLEPEQGGFRQVRLDFQGPTAGRVLVVLSLAPRRAVTRQPLLRFPKVVVPGAAGAPDAAYGVRAKGVAVDDYSPTGTIDYAPDALTREFAAVGELRLDPNSVVRVFRPVAAGSAELRPLLRPLVEPPGVTTETTWHLSTRRADAAGSVKWSAKDARALIEFTPPAAKVTEVRGAEVAAWSQSGGRVQVWLKRPAREGEFAWSATTLAPPSPFEAATPHVSDSRLATDSVRLRAADGFVLAVERDRGWSHAAPDDPFAYRTTNAAFTPVRVVVSAAPPALRADGLGWLSPRARSKPPDRPEPRPPAPANPVPPRPAAPPAVPPPDVGTAWVWPVSAAVGWGVAVALLALLIARWPASTWPEQFALVASLFGVAVAGGWWVGVLAWAAARAAWLLLLVGGTKRIGAA